MDIVIYLLSGGLEVLACLGAPKDAELSIPGKFWLFDGGLTEMPEVMNNMNAIVRAITEIVIA